VRVRGGLALGAVLGMLYLGDLVVELTIEMLAALPTARPEPGTIQTGLARMRQSIGGFRARMVDRLKTLVREKTSIKETAEEDAPSTVVSQTPTAAPIPKQSINRLSISHSEPPGTHETVTNTPKA